MDGQNVSLTCILVAVMWGTIVGVVGTTYTFIIFFILYIFSEIYFMKQPDPDISLTGFHYPLLIAKSYILLYPWSL